MPNKNLPYRTSPIDEHKRSYDPLLHAVTVIRSGHRMAHDGFMYHTSGKITGILNAAETDVYMKAPAGVYPHFSRALMTFGDGDIDVETYESTIVSDPGTPVLVHNTNRNSSNVNAMQIYGAPTVTDPGVLLHQLWAPDTGATGSHQIGISNVQNGEEWILRPDTGYMLRITNNSGGTISLSYEFLFYEVDYVS